MSSTLSERTILAIDVEDGAGFDLPIVIRITGDGFLRHMVRNIVGTLVEVGVGRWGRLAATGGAGVPEIARRAA